MLSPLTVMMFAWSAVFFYVAVHFWRCGYRLLGVFMAVLGSFLVAIGAHADPMPRQAPLYRLELIRSARAVWGWEAPIAAFAGQIHQESRWRPNVCSPYACGLTQFTPSTAEWIHSVYGSELGPKDRFNPTWAIRALVRYNRHLWENTTAADDCSRMVFVLWKYNGGPKWVQRDRALAKKNGKNPDVWSDVEPYNAGRRADFFKENRDYPRKILFKHQPIYRGWGRTICLTSEG